MTRTFSVRAIIVALALILAGLPADARFAGRPAKPCCKPPPHCCKLRQNPQEPFGPGRSEIEQLIKKWAPGAKLSDEMLHSLVKQWDLQARPGGGQHSIRDGLKGGVLEELGNRSAGQSESRIPPHLTWTIGWALSSEASPSKIVSAPESLSPREVWDATRRAREQAFSEYMREPMKDLGLDSSRWKLKSSSTSMEARTTLVRSLAAAAPRESPELVFFLDKKDFERSLEEMTKAWKGPTRELPPPDLVEAFFKSLSGKAVYLVGHIEGPAFVMKRSDGQVERADVSALVDLALKHNVKLFPLGCRGIDAGAPVGFSRNIDTSEVATVLAGVPEHPARMADLLKPFELLGDAWFNVDLAHHWIEAAIVKRDAPASNEAEVRFKFSTGGPGGPAPPSVPPGGSGGSTGGTGQPSQSGTPAAPSSEAAWRVSPDDFDDWFERWRLNNLPWYMKAGIGTMVRYVQSHPFQAALMLAAVLAAITSLAAWVSERPSILGSRRTAWIGRVALVTALTTGVGLVLLIAGAMLWFAAIFAMIFVEEPTIFVVAAALIGLLWLFRDDPNAKGRENSQWGP